MEERKKKKYVPSPEQRKRYAENRRLKLANETPEERAIRMAKVKASHDKRMQDPVKRAAEQANKKAYVARRLAENPNWLKEKYLEGHARKKARAEALEATLKEGERVCHYCCKAYPEEEFPVSRTGERSTMCSKCFRRVAGSMNVYDSSFWELFARRMNNRVRRKSRNENLDIPFEEITGKQLEEMFHKQEHKCVYCGVELNGLNVTGDHIVPLTKNGAHTLDNIQLVCRSCNEAKFQSSDEAYRSLLEMVNSFKP